MRLEDLLKGIIEIPSYEEPKELFRFALITYIERMGVITEGNFERFYNLYLWLGEQAFVNFEEEDATAILEGILKPVLFIVRKRVEPNDEVMNESLRTFVVDLIGFITSARRVTLSTFNEFNTLYRRLKINLPLVFEDLQDVNYPQKRVINANYILEQLIKRTFFEVEVRFERAEM